MKTIKKTTPLTNFLYAVLNRQTTTVVYAGISFAIALSIEDSLYREPVNENRDLPYIIEDEINKVTVLINDIIPIDRNVFTEILTRTLKYRRLVINSSLLLTNITNATTFTDGLSVTGPLGKQVTDSIESNYDLFKRTINSTLNAMG